MCIISLDVDKVKKTNIFVGINKDKTRQITIYSNSVLNKQDANAMILPVPNPETVKFIDLSSYKTIFDDCNKSFPLSIALSNTRLLSLKLSDCDLEVIKVGSYQVSLAMNLDDIERIDKNVFVLSEGCNKLLHEEYPTDFGFIVCKLVKGNENYHPLAYSHDIISTDKIFIPTKHYHHDNNDNYKLFKSSGLEEWDHSIYLFNLAKNDASWNTMPKFEFEWNNNLKVKLEDIDFDFDYDNIKTFSKHLIHGHYQNIDLYCHVVD